MGSEVRTHPNCRGVRGLDGRCVEAGEEGAVTHGVTLSEDQRTGLTTGQLRVQPPDLRETQSPSSSSSSVTDDQTDSSINIKTGGAVSLYRGSVCGGVADCNLDQSSWFHSCCREADVER